MDPLIGTVIAHYRLTERLDVDPDGATYRAVDENLGREVAVRVLPSHLVADPIALARFRVETQVASALSHPNIRAVHDYSESRKHVIMVCELLDGRSLDVELSERPASVARAVEIASQVADAVAFAHGRRVTHGALNARRVFLTTAGHVKVLGFGEAYAAHTVRGSSEAHETGSAVVPVPLQSDIETARESAGDIDADVRAIRELFGTMVGASADSLPPELRRILPNATAAGESGEYRDAASLAADLRRLRRQLEPSGIESAAGSTRIKRFAAHRPRVVALVVVITLAAAAAAAAWLSRGRTSGERDSILLGEVANGTADPNFDGTLRQALAVHLSQSPFLDVVSDERLREALRLMGREPDSRLTHDLAREACVRLGLEAMVEGSVAALGSRTLVSVVATDCGSGEAISRGQAEVEAREEVLGAVGRLATQLRGDLGESLATRERYNAPIEQVTTPSLEALKAYTLANGRRAAGQEIESIPFFKRAIELDPNFGLAYTSLSSVYGNLGETDLSEQYARLAYERSGRVSERERAFLASQYHDRVTGDELKAIEALEVWKRSFPKDYRAPNALAVLLNRLGQYDRAILEASDAQRRNPDHPFPYSNLAYAYRAAGRYGEAREAAARAVDRGIATVPTRRLLYQVAVLQRDEAEAQRQLDWARGQRREYDLTGARAQVLAFDGRLTEAREEYDRTAALARAAGFPQVAIGYLTQAAWTEVLYGYPERGVAKAREAMTTATTYAPRLRAAAVLALAGVPAEARAAIERERTLRPQDTLLHSVYLPVAEAALALAARQPQSVIERLRVAAPYERGSVAALAPTYLRARAFALNGSHAEAEREFRVILDNRGADPFSATYPLAQLELARSLLAQRRVDDARAAYEAFFTLWSGAEQDIPVLREAREEFGKLQS